MYIEDALDVISSVEDIPDFLLMSTRGISDFFAIDINAAIFSVNSNLYLQLVTIIRMRYFIQLARVQLHVFHQFPDALLRIRFEDLVHFPKFAADYYSILGKYEYMKNFDYDISEKYFQLSTIFAREKNDLVRVHRNKQGQAAIYLHRDRDFNSALHHLSNAQQYFIKYSLQYDLLKVYHALTVMWLQLGDKFAARREIQNYLQLADELEISEGYVNFVCKNFTIQLVQEDEGDYSILEKSIMLHAQENNISYHEALQAIILFEPDV